MKKIPSLFKRDYESGLVYNEVVEGSEWVINGEGATTQKFDGTSCMIKNGRLYKRYDVKHGRKAPDEGIPCQELPDQNTGHWPWWVPCHRNNAQDKWHFEAFDLNPTVQDGTYELVGPKINSNNENYPRHLLLPHGMVHLIGCPRDYEGIKNYLDRKNVEGIVWHHLDGRMVKIKTRDFGLKWPKD